MRILRSGMALALAALLVGCAQLRANVESFSAMENAYLGKTVAIAPYEHQEDSLEFKAHAEKLAAKLTTAGMKVVPFDRGGPAPDYVAFLDFGIDAGQAVPYSYTEPIYGPTGTTTSTTTYSSYGNSVPYSGTTTYEQSYGVIGYDTVTGTRTKYTRELYLDIMAVKPDGNVEKAYEARLTSSGSCGNLNAVMDSLLHAVFQSFPKTASGEVSAPRPENC